MDFNKCQINNLTLTDSDRIYALIRDSGVRWNSTYMMIERAIRLRESLDEYYHRLTRSLDPADKEAQEDGLSSGDWEMLVRIKSILGPFFQATKRMEGNVVEGTHGALWEVVVSLECLIQRLEEQQVILSNDLGNRYLSVCVGLALQKLTDYVGKTERAPVWLASLVLHPSLKWANLDSLWQHREKRSLYEASRLRVQTLWIGSYQDKVPVEENSNSDIYDSINQEDDIFQGFTNTRTAYGRNLEVKDEYMRYITKDPEENVKNPLQCGGIISLIILTSHEWRLTFLQFPPCLQSVNEHLVRLATQFQLVGAT